MHPAEANRRLKDLLNTSDAGPSFGSTNLAAAAIRGALTLAVLSALLLIAAHPAQAQTETVLYSFCSPYGCTDPALPGPRLTFDGAGNLYGTSRDGGVWESGTVFELSPNGSGGWNETVLYSFCSGRSPVLCADGANPSSYVIFDNLGNLYGTAGGGANGYGVVFELSPVGGSWMETVLYSFPGEFPYTSPGNGLIMDPAGNFFGTLYISDENGQGQGVFELSRSGDGWAEETIYAEDTTPSPTGLTMDAAGNIFGATSSTVFELSPNGTGGWNPTVIRSSTYLGNVGTPVLDKAGNLYLTAANRGVKNFGKVYKLSPGKKGKWFEQILYTFKGGPEDGSVPGAGIVFDAEGNIYGTTTSGGKYGDAGTVFELVAPVGRGRYAEKILWSFNVTDGEEPESSLILDSAGNLYGTTYYGGSGGGGGVVFEVTP
jgi:uncharacterized repeat protein (TIGR03803 family)